ncbi:hypothetical protein PPL_04668 [Heterostelium album PN500]|uniref:Uncharacterized protein n=1 Tax=Heterostelium pallidum (strain ATCC 26659 / Pp 5 / PN500) TaxID=670386 RepID=D3B877_HETP5|nr:hypothetical protein PPL_04668 [Heterostelium album PN500]EFA82245.1 hypothetical protein PPL_04668 [Heterostelium album PN500]|eukprot:XP_020434362.1 hypothetical protein PPL_04668 [Heterostelium album PN500]
MDFGKSFCKNEFTSGIGFNGGGMNNGGGVVLNWIGMRKNDECNEKRPALIILGLGKIPTMVARERGMELSIA